METSEAIDILTNFAVYLDKTNFKLKDEGKDVDRGERLREAIILAIAYLCLIEQADIMKEDKGQ